MNDIVLDRNFFTSTTYNALTRQNDWPQLAPRVAQAVSAALLGTDVDMWKCVAEYFVIGGDGFIKQQLTEIVAKHVFDNAPRTHDFDVGEEQECVTTMVLSALAGRSGLEEWFLSIPNCYSRLPEVLAAWILNTMSEAPLRGSVFASLHLRLFPSATFEFRKSLAILTDPRPVAHVEEVRNVSDVLGCAAQSHSTASQFLKLFSSERFDCNSDVCYTLFGDSV